jgi:hypothetical protein
MAQQNNPSDPLLISYLTLRKSIGWLGILLPVVLFVGNFLISWFTDFENGCNPYKSSISHYYYSRLGEIFTGTLCGVSLFLFTYNGHPKKEGEKGLSDRFLSILAASFALGVVLFPTSSLLPIPCNLRTFVTTKLTGNIHLTCASLFFLTLAYMSYFNFTKTSGDVTPQKLKRNKIYKICAIAMIASLLGCALYIFILEDHKIGWLDYIHPVFCFEATALLAFGFSWLTKGEFLLKDS